MKSVAVLAAAGLLLGAMAVSPASAGDKKCAVEGDLVKHIDADLKRLDKELFGWLRRKS
jgi:hypothetical protein